MEVMGNSLEILCEHCNESGNEENPVYLFYGPEEEEFLLHHDCKKQVSQEKDILLIGYFRPDIAFEINQLNLFG